jgi:hypothetical protein
MHQVMPLEPDLPFGLLNAGLYPGWIDLRKIEMVSTTLGFLMHLE